MIEIFLTVGMCFISDAVMQCVRDRVVMESNHSCQMKVAELNRANKDIYHARVDPAEYGVEVPKKTPQGVEFDPKRTMVKLLPPVCERNDERWANNAFGKKGRFKVGEKLRYWGDPIYH